MSVPYLIIFEGRNGSSQLVSLLNAHPNSLCYPEIMISLDEAEQETALAAVVDGSDLRPVNGYAADDNYYPQGFEKKWDSRPFRTVGFKAKVSDFKNILTVMEKLECFNYRLIHLRRANPLKAVLSLINGRRLAEKTQYWNARHPGEIQGPVTIDMHDFRNGLRHRHVTESLHRWFFDIYSGKKTTVFYEDMLSDQYGFVTQVFNFLGFPTVSSVQSAFVGSFLKNTPDSLRKAVLNYEDLVREYGNTEFARYLD